MKGTYRQEQDAIIDQIITDVSGKKDCDPLELPPLYDVIDLDALGQLVHRENAIEISFSYLDYQVTIKDGHVHVAPE